MNWYYVENGERIGPVEESELLNLEMNGHLNDQTLVWKSGMENWLPYGQVKTPASEQATQLLGDISRRLGGAASLGTAAAPAAASPTAASPEDTVQDAPQALCAECGGAFPQNTMVPFGEQWVCASCKPFFFQKIKEGVSTGGAMRYAGFWIRFAAILLDSLILVAVNMVVVVPFFAPDGQSFEYAFRWSLSFNNYLGLLINMGFTVFFLGKYAATPGKMACGIHVLRAGGERITYLRAFARFWAEQLSAITCLIGYIMAGFDSEKRALHDHICDTRVVFK